MADGLTKPLLGQDLGIVFPESQEGFSSSSAGYGGAQITAMMAMVLGSSMISQAEAMKSEDEEIENFEAIWVGGICLMPLGAIYAGQMGHSLSACCLRRLVAASRRNDLVTALDSTSESSSLTKLFCVLALSRLFECLCPVLSRPFLQVRYQALSRPLTQFLVLA